MFPPDDFRLQITDDRPDWKGRAKLGLCIVLALIPIAAAIAHHVMK